jgi:hypothetical protein
MKYAQYAKEGSMQFRVWFLVATILCAGASFTAAQIVDPEPDHLKCYTIRHLQPVDPQLRTVELRNQFRKERCQIEVPARRFCVETVKRIGPNDPGDDPLGGPAGHFLCYNINDCEEERVASQKALAIDQFGQWPIQVRRAQQVCTPVNKIHPIPVAAE